MPDKQKLGATEAKGKSVADAPPAKGEKPASKEAAGKAAMSAKDTPTKGKGKGG
jgi:hypothetical protein